MYPPPAPESRHTNAERYVTSISTHARKLCIDPPVAHLRSPHTPSHPAIFRSRGGIRLPDLQGYATLYIILGDVECMDTLYGCRLGTGEDRDLDAPSLPQVSEDRDPILGRTIASRSQLTMKAYIRPVDRDR